MAGITIHLTGLNEAFRRFKKVRDGLTHARGMWDNVGAAIEQQIAERFEGGYGPGKSKWPPSLRARFEGGQTLVNTRILRDSLTRNPSLSRIATDNGVSVGTNVQYAAIHQFGGTIHRKQRRQKLQFAVHKRTGKVLRGFRKEAKSNYWMMADVGAHDVRIPARPFLGIDEDSTDRIMEAMEKWMASIITK